MTVDIGDILLWKHIPVFDYDNAEYFLVLDIDKEYEDPYLCLCLNTGLHERFTGRTFGNAEFWEIVA
jgi:hypothetical protein